MLGEIYRNQVRKFMGSLQEIIKKTAAHKLDDQGRIHYRNFLAFNSHKWIKLTDPKEICEETANPSSRCSMLAGFLTMVKYIVSRAASDEGLATFTDKSLISEDLPIDERNEILKKREEVGEELSNKFQSYMNNLLERIKAQGLFQEWSCYAVGMARKRAEDAELYDGKYIPDPNIVVPLFLEDDWCEEQERIMIRCAMNIEEVTLAKFANFNQFLPVRMACMLGNRKEALGNLSIENWLERVKTSELPNHRKNLPSEGLQTSTYKGYKLVQRFHKTGDQSVLYIWIDEVSEFLGRCYHECRCKLFGEPSLNDAFFVTCEGNQLIRGKDGLPLRMWDKIIDYPGSISFVFRDMYINYFFRLADITLKDSLRFSTNHSNDVEERHYVTEISKQLKALTTVNMYHKSLNIQQSKNVASCSGVTNFSKESREREIKLTHTLYMEKVQRRLDYRKRIDDAKLLTSERSVNESTKVSFIKITMLEDELKLKINEEGTLMDLFLVGRRSDPSKYVSCVIKALDTLPSDNDDVKLLHDHLYSYCEILSVEEPLLFDSTDWFDKVEERWIVKIVNQLGYLSRNETSNPRIKHLFASIYMRYGNAKYLLGSESLFRQVRKYVEKIEKYKKDCLDLHGKENSSIPSEVLTAFDDRLNNTTIIKEKITNDFVKECDEIVSSRCNAGLEMDDVEKYIDSEYSESEETIESVSSYDRVWQFDNIIIRQNSGTPVKVTKLKKTVAPKLSNSGKRVLLERIIDHMRSPLAYRGKKGQSFLREDIWEPFYKEGPEKRSFDGLETCYWRGGYPMDNKKGLQDIIREVVGQGDVSAETVKSMKVDILAYFDNKI